MNRIAKAIKIAGISTVTSNEAAFNQNTIGKLWEEFLKIPIKEKLSDISSSRTRGSRLILQQVKVKLQSCSDIL